MATLLSVRCAVCNSIFQFDQDQYSRLRLPSTPKRCPACNDRKQGRPDITLARTELYSVVCRVSSLPGDWFIWTAAPRERSSGRITIKGRAFGATWNGRIDVYAHGDQLPQPGDVVRVSAMEVLKQIAKRHWSHPTLEHGVVGGWRQIPLSEAGPEDRIEDEVRRYIRIDPASGEDPEDRELVWVTAHTKTTIKGFGRQYWAHLGGKPLWHVEVHGGYRSGRAYTAAWLAVVTPEHPVIRRFTENGETIEWRVPETKEV